MPQGARNAKRERQYQARAKAIKGRSRMTKSQLERAVGRG
jgi:hypothetical protein